MSLVLAFLLPAFFALLIVSLGEALAARLLARWLAAPSSWLERICLGAVAVILVLALFGLVVINLPYEWRQAVARAGLLLLAVGALGVFAARGWKALRAAPAQERLFFVGYAALCVLSMALALFPARLPSTLIDGPYVAKHDLLGVRVQYTTGNLPTDNAIPHVVSEYLLRDISFRTEHPIMPGQEVTNRPILAAVLIAPFRAATYMPPRQSGPLPRFTYVGSEWPDFSVLMRDERGYRVSQAIGIALNALLLLVLGAFASRAFPVSLGMALAICGLFLTSPYFLFQTYFTWPKALAGFFVICAWLSTRMGRIPVLTGIALGLAYLSHPYAIAFFGAYLLWYVWQAWLRRRSAAAIDVASLVVAFAITVAPWLLWKASLALPSDLVAQNLIIPGQKPIDFLWVRIANSLNAFLPGHLLGYPFDVMRIVTGSAVNVAGAIGVLAAIVLLHRSFSAKPEVGSMVLWGIPAALLIGVFSNAAVPALHGMQPLIAVLLAIAVIHCFGWLGARGAAWVLGGQAAVNVVLMARYFKKLL